MNKIIENIIDTMFDEAIVTVTERKDEEDILDSMAIILLADGKFLKVILPTDLTGVERLRIITQKIKKASEGKFLSSKRKKKNKFEVIGFIYFFEAWICPKGSDSSPTYDPDRQTALGIVAGDVDGYYNGLQIVSTFNGKSFVGDREIDHFSLNENCMGRFGRVLTESNLKFKKMDDDIMSRVLKEMI